MKQCPDLSAQNQDPVLYCYQFLVIQLSLLMCLLGVSFEAKVLGTHKYREFNDTGMEKRLLILLVLLAGLIPDALVKKGVTAGLEASGANDDIVFMWMKSIVTGAYHFYCFGLSRWICFKLSLINTKVSKTKQELERLVH